MAIVTIISPKQISEKETSLEMKWPTDSKSLTVQLEDTLFVNGSCRIVIEGDYQDGRGYVFIASANGIVAGAKGQKGESPSITLPNEPNPPATVRLSIIPEEGIPVVGLKTDAEVI